MQPIRRIIDEPVVQYAAVSASLFIGQIAWAKYYGFGVLTKEQYYRTTTSDKMYYTDYVKNKYSDLMLRIWLISIAWPITIPVYTGYRLDAKVRKFLGEIKN